MAETYKVIFPGNFVNRLNAYPLPNPDFYINKRGSTFWGDRQQQAALVMPGWLAVYKTAYLKVGSTAITNGNPILPSPTTRPDDKPLADISGGLTVPKGALLYRLGLRAPWVQATPSASSYGVNRPTNVPLDTGIIATAGTQIVLASAVPTVIGTGSITTAGGSTSSTPATAWNNVAVGQNALTFSTTGTLPAGSSSFTAVPGSAQAAVMAADTVFTIQHLLATGVALGTGFRSTALDGSYLVGEVAYLVPDSVARLNDMPLPGMRYAGYAG